MAGEESKNKKEYRFYILRPGDGRYVFKCNSLQQRDQWTMWLDKVITVRPQILVVPPVIHRHFVQNTITYVLWLTFAVF